MRVPRVGVAGLMVLVAIAALDFCAIRAWSHLRIRHGVGASGRPVSVVVNTYDVLGVGGLPMANVLPLTLLFARRRINRGSFLGGFEAFGAAALAAYLAWSSFYTDQSVMPYLHSVLRPLTRALRQHAAALTPGPVVNYVIVALMLSLPQLAFALAGGLLFRRLATGDRAAATRC